MSEKRFNVSTQLHLSAEVFAEDARAAEIIFKDIVCAADCVFAEDGRIASYWSKEYSLGHAEEITE